MKVWIVCVLLLLGVGPGVSVATAQGMQEVRVEWDAHVGASAPQAASRKQPGQASTGFTLLDRRRGSGMVPRQRRPELSESQIVVVAVDRNGFEVDRQYLPDPRLLRAEGFDATGKMSGDVLHHAKTELLISLPDDPAITDLRLYHPRWTGTAFVLDLLGTVNLR